MIPTLKYFCSIFLHGGSPFKKKVFVITMQRSGTTSAGRLLEDCGYAVASNVIARRANWINNWVDGEYASIVRSWSFNLHSGFQDSIFWTPDFYKYLAVEFPTARFVLLTRPSEDWFKSMLSHSDGMNPGDPYIHAVIYSIPIQELEPVIGSGNRDYHKIAMLRFKEHYMRHYENYNRNVVQYFADRGLSERLFTADLYDDDLWGRMAEFIGCQATKTKYHEHKSVKK